MAAYLEVRTPNPFKKAQIDINGDDMSRKADTVRKPEGNRPAAGANLQAIPTRADTELLNPEGCLRISP